MLVTISLIWVLLPAAVELRFALTRRVGLSRTQTVPVIVELEAPLT